MSKKCSLPNSNLSMFHMPSQFPRTLFQVKGSPVQELRETETETETETEAETCIFPNTDVYYASLRACVRAYVVRTNVREHEIVVNAYAGQSARGRSGFELT
jgi:hypothetical protein